MKLQVILQKENKPIRFDKVKAITLSNSIGLKIIGTNYTNIFPLEKINALMVADNESSSN